MPERAFIGLILCDTRPALGRGCGHRFVVSSCGRNLFFGTVQLVSADRGLQHQAGLSRTEDGLEGRMFLHS
jgi:hypothetical protein